jgi:hypothetical protein
MTGTTSRSVLVFACGVLVGVAVMAGWERRLLNFAGTVVQAQQPRPPVAPADVPAEVTRLRDLVPNQSLGMADVGNQFTNLWFAEQRRNWPLAQYFYNETRNRIRWVVRIAPTRKKSDDTITDVQGILDGIETSSMAMLKDSIEKKNSVAFVAAYKTMIESCYACHKAVEKPFLRPMIPLTQTQTVLNLSPTAKWPE